MTWRTRVVAELRRIAGGMTVAREDRAVREEIRFHIDMQTAKLRDQGMSDAEARRRATIAFGGEARWIEAARDEYRSRPLDEALRDTRFVVRSLVRAPAFTVTALLTLATGIGTAAAIFTVVDHVVVRPLPYGHPGELVSISHDMSALSFANAGITPGVYFTYQRMAHSLDGIAIYTTGSVNATDPAGAAEPERLTSASVSGNFMSLFQVPAALGRTLSPSDDEQSAPSVMVISDALWRMRFGGSPSVIGKKLFAAGAEREIVGVMPPWFRVPDATTQVWFPMQLNPAAPWLGGFRARAYGRLRPTVSVVDATRDLRATLPRAIELFPLIAPGLTAKLLFEQGKPTPRVTALRENLIADVAPTLWVVAAAAGLVLLVMGANVANLMLVRAESRHRELAIRAAMGASRWRIVSYFLIESAALAGVASALGMAAAAGAVRFLVDASPIEIPRLAEVRVDAWTIAFIVATSLLVAVACALPPALRSIRSGLSAGLRDSGRNATSAGARVRTRSVLVVVQMALALVALVASGLLFRSFDRLRAVKPGFDPNGVVTLWVAAPPVRYPQQTDVDRFHSNLLERVRALPGVTAAGITTSLPLRSFGHMPDPLFVEGSRDATKAIPPLQMYAGADAGYFGAMKIPLIAGRMFASLETQRWNEALVSQETATRMFGDSTGATVIGKRFQNLPDGPLYTVIGVVGSVRDTSLMLPATMAVYLAPVATQDTVEGPLTRTVAVVARTTGDVDATTRAMRGAVREVDPTLPVFDVRPMSEIVNASMARLVFVLIIIGIAAGVTLLLGIVGLYGVIAFVVSLRTRELGLRIALGATPRAVASMVAKRGLLLSAVGTGAGAVVAAIIARFLRMFLFEIAPLDPVTMTAAIVVLTACAVAASWGPARRASRMDPVRALRAD
jgi:putative ABC transport system permease protein